MTSVWSEQEAIEAGLTIRRPQPEDEVCEFCGKRLRHQGAVFFGSVMLWSPFPERCKCSMAVDKWERYDAEKKRLEEEEKEAQKRQEEEKRIATLIGNSGIKKRFAMRTFDCFKTDTPQRKQAYTIAKRYADNWDKCFSSGIGLYIEGTNGTGKTHLAAAIALQLMTQRNIPVICKTAADMLLDIRNAFSDPSKTEKQVLDVYKSVDLLIIDDLGKEQCTDWAISTLYSIVNDRYEEMKPIIITTNYNSDGLAAALTPRGYDDLKVTAIISRLRETCKVLTMAWQDYRVGR